jgi:hypothetical protein
MQTPNDHTSSAGIMGSDAARGMDVRPHFSVLCSLVKVEALQWVDPSFKEHSQIV